jgi:hypothetical protein
MSDFRDFKYLFYSCVGTFDDIFSFITFCCNGEQVSLVSWLDDSVVNPFVDLLPTESCECDCFLSELFWGWTFNIIEQFPNNNALPAKLRLLSAVYLSFALVVSPPAIKQDFTEVSTLGIPCGHAIFTFLVLSKLF